MAVVACAALLATLSRTAAAQSVGRMLGDDLRDAAGDIVSVWGSPLRAGPRDWLGAAAVVAGAAAISPWDDDVDRWIVRHHDASYWSALHAFREGGIAFTGRAVAPVVGAVYVAGLATRNRGLRDGVIGCIVAAESEGLVRTQLGYRLIGRTRPDSSLHHVVEAPPARAGDQYRFRVPVSYADWGDHAFPAGHMANVAACASFLGMRFDLHGFAAVPYAIAAAVGAGRMVDRRHWLSDTVLGAIYGYAAGRAVAARQLHRAEARSGAR